MCKKSVRKEGGSMWVRIHNGVKKKSAKKTYFNRTNEKKAPRQSTASIQSINTDTLANIYYRNIPWENKNHIIYTPVWNDKYTFSLYIYGTKHRH